MKSNSARVGTAAAAVMVGLVLSGGVAGAATSSAVCAPVSVNTGGKTVVGGSITTKSAKAIGCKSTTGVKRPRRGDDD